jgi:hypothetical protein
MTLQMLMPSTALALHVWRAPGALAGIAALRVGRKQPSQPFARALGSSSAAPCSDDCLYAVLGISESATAIQIKEAFRKVHSYACSAGAYIPG